MSLFRALNQATFLVCFAAISDSSPATAADLRVVSEFEIHYDLGNHRIPKWANGVLAVVEGEGKGAPIVHLFDRQGRELAPVVVSIPGASKMMLEGAVLAGDGKVAVIGSAYDAGKGGGFLAIADISGSPQKIVRTFPYVPYLIAAGPGGGVWTGGLEMVAGKESHSAVNAKNGVLRRFAVSGDLAPTYIPREEFGGPNFGLTGGWLAVGKDRVGWYTQDDRYFEVSAEGKVSVYAGHPDLVQSVSGLAITDSGKVILSGVVPGNTPSQPGKKSRAVLAMLDRRTGAWQPLAWAADLPALVIYGSEGEQVVMRGDSLSRVRFATIGE